MSQDSRSHSDLELLEELLQGRIGAQDPRLHELFARRPEWRELAERAGQDDSRDVAPEWRGQASEADRRLVAECLAEARAGVGAARRPRRAWFALAASLVAAFGLWLGWREFSGPPHPPDPLLGPDASLDSIREGRAAADFRTFEWTSRRLVPGKESFALTVWAVRADGSRGDVLLRRETREARVEIEPARRESWPNEILWRVERLDASSLPTSSPEWRTQRGPR